MPRPDAKPSPGPSVRPADLRQQALVYDWCQDLLSEPQNRDLAARLQRGIAELASNDAIAAVRARAMAAVALFDHVPQIPRQELENVVRKWWARKVAPDLAAGRNVVAREDAYALYELLHVLRDNTNVDLRESARTFFRGFPTEHLVSYYPAPWKRRKTTTISAPPAAQESPICARPRFPGRRNWPWWPSTPTRRTRNCCKAG